jgi:hypothetical protein
VQYLTVFHVVKNQLQLDSLIYPVHMFASGKRTPSLLEFRGVIRLDGSGTDGVCNVVEEGIYPTLSPRYPSLPLLCRINTAQRHLSEVESFYISCSQFFNSSNI